MAEEKASEQANTESEKPKEEANAAAEASKTKEAEYKPVTLKLPDGSPLDPSRVERIAALAKERKLSQEAADEYLSGEHEAVSGYLEKQKNEIKSVQDKWLADLKADPEIGGDKQNESVELAKRVVSRFGSESLAKALNDSGLGNHPELVRVFAKIGREMGDDKLVLPGSKTSGEVKSDEDLFHGKTKK